MDEPVPATVVESIFRKFPDFRRAYSENGLSVAISIRLARPGERCGNSFTPVTTSMDWSRFPGAQSRYR